MNYKEWNETAMSYSRYYPGVYLKGLIRGGADIVLSPIRKEKSYSDQTRDLLNILPTKLNTLLSPLL